MLGFHRHSLLCFTAVVVVIYLMSGGRSGACVAECWLVSGDAVGFVGLGYCLLICASGVESVS